MMGIVKIIGLVFVLPIFVVGGANLFAWWFFDLRSPRGVIPTIDLRAVSLPQWYCRRRNHVWALVSDHVYTKTYRCVLCQKHLYR